MGLSQFMISAAMAGMQNSATVPHAATGATALQVADIIVTGERVRRPVRETASSVIVIDESEIRASSADTVEQLLRVVPNITLGSGTQGPVIRGQDTTGALQALPAFLGGNRPRTTLVIDGRRQTYNEFVFGEAPLWDIDRVEVFRSPQTTTQGQNSIAGAIFIHSNDPAFDEEAQLRFIGGSRRLGQLSALISAPVGEDLALRVSGDLRYVRSASRIRDVMAGADPNHKAHGQVRAKLLALPSALPQARITLTYSHLEAQSPQIEGVKPPFKRRRDILPNYGVFRTNVDSLTGALRYEFEPSFVGTLTASAGDSSSRRLAIPGFGETSNKGRDWALEGILNWSRPSGLSAVTGFSANRVRLRQAIDLSLFSGLGHFRDVQDAFGLFGEAEFPLLSRMTLTAGLRYQQDRQRRLGEFEAATLPIPLEYDRTFRAWLPKVSLAFEASRDVRVGAMVQRAYNPGGTTLRFDIGAPDNFEAETLWNYELFARASLLGGRVNLASNLFYTAIRDAQRARSIVILAPNGLGVGFADMFNVPRARAYGGEVELRFRALDRLEARAGAGILGTRIAKAGSAATEYRGKEFERAPHFTASVAMEWRPIDALRLSGAVRHSSGYFSDDKNSPVLRIQGYTTADLRAQFRRRGLSAFIFANNVFDEFHLTYLSLPNSGTAGAPRQIGLGLEADF